MMDACGAGVSRRERLLGVSSEPPSGPPPARLRARSGAAAATRGALASGRAAGGSQWSARRLTPSRRCSACTSWRGSERAHPRAAWQRREQRERLGAQEFLLGPSTLRGRMGPGAGKDRPPTHWPGRGQPLPRHPSQTPSIRSPQGRPERAQRPSGSGRIGRGPCVCPTQLQEERRPSPARPSKRP